MESKIVADNLTKNYVVKEKNGLFRKKKRKVIQAVKDISLEIPKGSIIGLLGINGAGKTTTIRMLSSVIIPTKGDLTLDGMDAVKDHLKVKERINVITGGERNLYWRLTAVENLQYFGSLYGLSAATVKDRSEQLLRMVGLKDAADMPVERYSKGMKQRLQIARGLINDPEYLFLDEPTLGLDIVIAREIRGIVHRLAREENKGVLLTTHYISEAEELCDYIYVIDKGEIIAQGTKQELKKLFEHRQELLIKTSHLTEKCAEQLQQYIELSAGSVQIRVESKAHIYITGTPEHWKEILDMLLKCEVPIISMEMKEPDLEETLMYLIKQSRERRPA